MSTPKVIIVSGGTDGMGRALALARAERGDLVVAIGSNAEKGRGLLAEAASRGAAERVSFLQADLTSTARTREVVATIQARHERVDALVLTANRQAAKRVTTAEGHESVFALYYLSRYLLSFGLRPQLDRAVAPVIVNVAGVGATKGAVHWDDLGLERRYSMVAAQLQAGRANDLLGVGFAAESGSRARYVLYHPGFTRSGDLSPLSAPLRVVLRVLQTVAARPVAESVEPIHGFIDAPPAAALTAIDRGRPLPLSLPTLDPQSAGRLMRVTETLLHSTGREERGVQQRPEPS